MKPSIGIELALPRRLGDQAARIGIAGFPPRADAGWTEVDILRVILAIDRRRQQANHVHAREAAIPCQVLHFSMLCRNCFRHALHQFGYDMSQPMQLLLPHDVGHAPGWNTGCPSGDS